MQTIQESLRIPICLILSGKNGVSSSAKGQTPQSISRKIHQLNLLVSSSIFSAPLLYSITCHMMAQSCVRVGILQTYIPVSGVLKYIQRPVQDFTRM